MKNLWNICIICMNSDKKLTTLKSFGRNKITYSAKLRTCLPIINSKHYDFQSGSLCEKCSDLVDDYFAFYELCVQTKWKLEEEFKKKEVMKPVVLLQRIDPNSIVILNKTGCDTIKNNEITNNNKTFERDVTTERVENVKNNEVNSDGGNRTDEITNEINVTEKIDNEIITEESDMVDEETLSEVVDVLKSEDEDLNADPLEDDFNELDDADVSKDVYKCSVCLKIYLTKRTYYRHIQSSHLAEFPYFCTPCRAPFRTETELMEHTNLKKCFIKSNFNCSQCPKKFSREISLENHIKQRHDGQRQYTCTDCGLKFNKFFILTLHIKTEHSNEKPFACEICNKRFWHKPSLKKHTDRHFSYTCECGQKFTNESNLSTHQKHEHQTIENDLTLTPKTYQCDKCGKVFQLKSVFIKHVQRHSNQNYACKYCRMKFKFKSNRDSHIKEIHKENDQYICEICGKQFLKKVVFDTHRNIHDGIKTHLCYVCGELFYNASTLTRHCQTHTGEDRKFACTYCPKKFKSNIDLMNHTRTHTGEKPYPCPHCGKCFAVKRQVTVHINSYHVDTKPYICEICNHGSPTYNSLKIHKIKHSNARPFSCPVCFASFKKKTEVRRHLKKRNCVEKWKLNNSTTVCKE